MSQDMEAEESRVVLGVDVELLSTADREAERHRFKDHSILPLDLEDKKKELREKALRSRNNQIAAQEKSLMA
jgi:hypothetical protein